MRDTMIPHSRHGRWTLALPLALLLAGCATNPVSGRREFNLVSSGQEEKMGREGYKAVLAEYGAYDDSTVQKYVSGVGLKLAKVSQLPDLDWHFTVIDDPSVNAFAMPGGYIYITRGILAHLNSEAQLAGVLGHEIGHVTARHTARQITGQQVAGIGLLVGTIVSPSFARYGDVAQQALGLMFLSYSREYETQADELGIQYTIRAGWDPREIPATYHMLRRVSDRTGARLPTFLSTHPDPGDREARTRTLGQSAAMGRPGLVVNASGYLAHVDGLVFGSDPRHGYFTNNQYFNPDLRLEVIMPPGWTYHDSRSSLVAVAPDQHSGMQLSGADGKDTTPRAHVSALLAKGEISEPDGDTETIGGHDAWVGRVTLSAKGGGGRVITAFVSWSPDLMLEILGSGGVTEQSLILSSIRSLRDMTDPKRIARRPDRVQLVHAPAGGGLFSALVPTLLKPPASQAIGLEETAILNNLISTEPVPAGQVLKLVEAGQAK
jgi:predicted Zn-dependent protease